MMFGACRSDMATVYRSAAASTTLISCKPLVGKWVFHRNPQIIGRRAKEINAAACTATTAVRT